MQVWWEQLTTLEHVLYYIAVPASLLMIIQTVMTFFGFDEEAEFDDFDPEDFDMETGFEDGFEVSFQIFTIRNFIAFFTFFGWGGLWAASTGKGTVLVVVLALISGSIMMMISAGFFFMMKKLSVSGNLILKNAIGKVGQVYLTIPAKGQGTGKVQIVVQGALREIDAMTYDDVAIKTGASIIVSNLRDEQTLIVSRENGGNQ